MTNQAQLQSLQSQAQPAREVELKFAVPQDSADALVAHLQARAAETNARQELTTYFDRPDHALQRAGISLRVRTAGGKRIQTLKADSQDGLAADRAEWEWKIDQDTPDLSLAEPMLTEHGLPPPIDLQPIFKTEIDRTTRILHLDSESVIETAWDEGRITAGDAHQPVRELELELRVGEAASLYRLACELQAVAPLLIETDSKAARGYRLATGAVPEIRKSREIGIAPHASAAEAFRQIVNACIGHLLANQAVGLAGEAEAVHQMRIAIRRLRAALVLFDLLLEPHAVALFEDELRRIGRVFGEARDWDVFCLQILPDTLASDHDAGWRDMLLQPATAARQAAHDQFARALRSPAFTQLLLGLAAWAEQMRMPRDPDLSRPVADLCPILLDPLAAKVARRGRQIRHRSETQLHALRKSLKKLRYAIDFLRPVLHPASLKSYLHDCKKLQKTLGDINDTVAATTLAERLVKGKRLELVPAVSLLAEQLDHRRNDALDRLTMRWTAFAGQPRFWA